MALLLGIDTGGTYTDAALLETSVKNPNGMVIAKAKSLTTRQDFAVGIAGAAATAIANSGRDPADIGMVSLSTTLATNALVEGQGGRIALITIGFAERDLKNAGLAEALGSDPVLLIDGGHTSHGSQANSLDVDTLHDQIEALASGVTGFAVAGYFAVRNPAHEVAVRDIIIEKTGKAVTCSHELSARLNGPKRALTTVLNARLVPMITRLIEATRRGLTQQNVTAPLMIVRGDGALVSAEFAARRPIETILSGPAASLVGACYLTGENSAFVNDIGGTTSDVAMLEGGKPTIDPDGARVGGYRTMVEAVSMHTFGLGGDSETTLSGPALKPIITLGPRRLVPVSLIAHQFGQCIHDALDKQIKSKLNNRNDGRFAIRSGAGLETGLSQTEKRIFDRTTDQPQALEDLLESAAQSAALTRLVEKGLILLSGLTPSDAIHADGGLCDWDRDAAIKALQLFGRQRDGGGNAYCSDPQELARRIINRVQRRSAEVILETAFRCEGSDGEEALALPLIQSILDQRALDNPSNRHVKLSLALDRPIIGLGASASSYHPQAADLLNGRAIIPDHADVANAIGAVVGQISVKAEATITQPTEGRFQVTGIEKPFINETQAIDAAEILVRENIQALAREAGAGDDIDISVEHDIKRANIESREIMIEARITALATGRPPIAQS